MNKDILKLMTERQLHNIRPEYHLKYSDMERIASKVSNNFLNCDECSLWNGYVTNLNNPKRGRYINFYFNKRKTPLHRLIYNNFKEEIIKGEYIKYNCENNGNCLNINHMIKINNKLKIKNNINDNLSTKVTFE